MSTETALIARQAAALEEALGLVDTGAFARRGSPGEATERRTAVVDTDDRLRESRIGLLMWVLHRTCTIRMSSGVWPAHPVEVHRSDAEAGVSALFPQAVV